MERTVEQIQIDSGEVLKRYRNVAAASSFMRVPLEIVLQCCSGTRATGEYEGFRWQYYSEDTAIDC